MRAAALLADRAGDALQAALDFGPALTAEQRAEAAVASYEAKVVTTKVGLDQRWRNLRTHTVHDPVAYKAREVGDWALNRRAPNSPSTVRSPAMGVVLHWFLPTNGDSRTDLSLGNAVGAAGSRVAEGGSERAPDIGYIGQIARSAEQLGFTGALTPTSSWCEDAWIMTAGLTQVTERFKFLVAFRPGLMSPTLAAQMAATYQRVSGGRLLLNVVTGGDDVEQQRFGDHLDKQARYERAGEFLHLVRELWRGDRVTFTGRHYDVRGGQIVPAGIWPDIYLGGSSAPALEVAARYADVYLTWGEPPRAVADKLDAVRTRAKAAGRELRFGIRLHVITRDTAAEAWAQAKRLLDGLDQTAIERAQAIQRASQSEGQRRMAALHGGRTDALEVSPNLWAGVGLVRGGAGTALVGSHDEVAERIAEYYALGIDEFILSGYPHLEEAYQVGEGLIPVLRRRGLMASPTSDN